MDIKQAQKAVKENKSKFKKAVKNHKVSMKHGTEKQQALCEKRMKAAKAKYLRSVVTLKNLRAKQPKMTDKVKNLPFKKIATWTGIGIGIVFTAIFASQYMNGDGIETEGASDTV